MFPRIPALVIALALSATLSAQDNDDKVGQLRNDFANAPGRFQLRTGETDQPLKLISDPVLNWSNPIRRTTAGGMFLWTLEGRPQAALCIYPNQTRYEYEFQSLATMPLVASVGPGVAWAPSEPGLEFQTLDMGTPANRAPARLLQLRGIARGFTAKLIGSEREVNLRMLTAPVYRYPAEELPNNVIDGAMFAFVQGTDPEVLLIVEAVRDEGQAKEKWQYGLARMSIVPSQVSYRGQSVWDAKPTRPRRDSAYHVVQVEVDDAVIKSFD